MGVGEPSVPDILAHNLRVLRDLAGMSQSDLAGRVGISTRTVARLEAAEIGDPGVEQCRSIARALGVTLSLLVEEKLVVTRVPLPAAARERLVGPGSGATLERVVRAACDGDDRA